MKNIFGRLNSDNNVIIFEECGEVATKLDADVYPVGSNLSVRYEHPRGIILTLEDAQKINIDIEN